MKIKKSEKLVWICIIATILSIVGFLVFSNLIMKIILMIFSFAGLFGIFLFSKKKDDIDYTEQQELSEEDIDIQIKEQEEIIKENVNTIKNVQQDFWKEKRNENIDYDDERLNQLKQLKQKYMTQQKPIDKKEIEYLDLSKSNSPFEKQILKKGINTQGYLDLTIIENQSEEYIKHKVNKLLEKKQIKIKSPQTKHHDDVVKNVDKDKTEDIKLKDEECLDLTEKQDISPKLTEKEKILQKELLELMTPDIEEKLEEEK